MAASRHTKRRQGWKKNSRPLTGRREGWEDQTRPHQRAAMPTKRKKQKKLNHGFDKLNTAKQTSANVSGKEAMMQQTNGAEVVPAYQQKAWLQGHSHTRNVKLSTAASNKANALRQFVVGRLLIKFSGVSLKPSASMKSSLFLLHSFRPWSFVFLHMKHQMPLYGLKQKSKILFLEYFWQFCLTFDCLCKFSLLQKM